MANEHDTTTPEDLDDEDQHPEDQQARSEDEKGKRDRDEDEDDGKGKRRPNRRDRTTERLFAKVSEIGKTMGETLPQLLARLEKLEKGQGEISRRSDPKPTLSAFESAEEYEAAYDEWRERHPKGTPEDKSEKKSDKSDKDETQLPSNERMAEAVGVTLETYEDFLEGVSDAREELEDYDEVMAETAALRASAPALNRELIEFGTEGAKMAHFLLKDRESRKEYKRIAALRTRDMRKALEAVSEQMGEEPDADREPNSPKENKQPPRTFKPLNGRTAPRSRVKDESTMTDEEWFAEENKKRGRR